MAFVQIAPGPPVGVYEIGRFGGQPDSVTDPNGAITAATNTLSSSSVPGPFVPNMVGKPVLVIGAGASGDTLGTTISGYTDAQHVTLAANAGTTVAAGRIFVCYTDNNPQFANAVAAACAAGGGEVRLPAGVFYMDYLAGIPAQVTGSDVAVKVTGAGPGLTWIVPPVITPTSAYDWLYCAPGNALYVDGMTVIAAPNMNGHGVKAIHHGGTSGELYVRRCDLWGFSNCMQADSGTALDVYAEDLDLLTSPILNLGGSAIAVQDIGGRCRLLNCDVVAWGVAAANQNHGFYIDQSVDLDVRGCWFGTNRGTGWSLHNFNGAGTSPAMKVVDCEFSSGSYQGVLGNATVRNLYDGCVFEGSQTAITIQMDSDINGCQFRGITAGNNYLRQSSSITAATNVVMRECEFETPAVTGTNPIYNNNATGANLWECNQCRFTCNESAAKSDTAPSVTVLRGCIYADEGAAHDTLIGGGVPTLSGLNANVANATVVGNDAGGYVQFDVITASIAAGANLFTLTFAQAFGNPPIVLLNHLTAHKVAAGFQADTPAAASVAIYTGTGTTLAVSTGYRVGYLIRRTS